MPRFKKGGFKKVKDKQQDRRISKIERKLDSIEIKQNEPLLTGLRNTTATLRWNQIFNISQMSGPTTSDYFNRVGNKIQPIEVQIDWLFQTTDAATVQYARAMLIRLSADNSSNPSDANMFVFGAADVFGALNYGNAVKYNKYGYKNDGPAEILYDSGAIPLLPVNVAVGTETTAFVKHIKLRHRCNQRLQATYNGVGGVNWQNNHYFWVTMATGGAGSVQERGSISGTFTDL